MIWRIMDLDGITAGEVEAPDAATAAEIAESRGYKVLDIMDDLIVIDRGA